MPVENEEKSNKTTTYLINTVLLLLICYIAFLFYDNHKPQGKKTEGPKELARLNDYGAQAYIGSDLKHLLPYDVKIPFVDGMYVVLTKGSHMIFTMKSNVEVSLADEVSVQIKNDGIDILSGEITINHPSGKMPLDFHIYSQGKLLNISELPAVIR